jgi:hypothetical protein
MEVTVMMREVWRNPGHTGVQIFVGRNPGARGCSGEVTMRTDEWDELAAAGEFTFEVGEALHQIREDLNHPQDPRHLPADRKETG